MELKDIHPNPDNPRSITDDARAELGESMGEFGDLSGFVFNHDGTIISGHQRWEEIKSEVNEFAIRETYETPLPEGTIQRGHFELNDGRKYDYAVRQWSVEKANAATIRANKENAGTWDVSKLPRLNFNQDEAIKFGVPEVVFEVDNALNSEKLEAQEDDYEIPDEIKTDIVPGDLFEIGRHRLLCGDSTSADDVARLMDGERSDMVFTDPPYGVSYQTDMTPKEAKARNRRKDGKEVSNDTLTGDGLLSFLSAAIANFPLRPGGSFYLCSPPGCTETTFRLSLGNEYPLRQQIVWVKQRFVFGRQDYHWRHETILYGWREGAAHYFVDDHTQDTVWEVDRPAKSPEHPTMKPIALVAKAIGNSSKPMEIVFDGFCGSGTTMVAAHQLNRRCYGMEIDPKYCQVIIDRMLKLDPTLEIKRNGEIFTNNNS